MLGGKVKGMEGAAGQLAGADNPDGTIIRHFPQPRVRAGRAVASRRLIDVINHTHSARIAIRPPKSCARTAIPTARVAATTVVNIVFIVLSLRLDGTARKESGDRSVV